jgi:hypothetical protein
MEVQKKCKGIIFTPPIKLDDVPLKFNLFLQRANLIRSSLKKNETMEVP